MTKRNGPELRVWCLLDGRPGNDAQARGVAQKLGIPFETKTLRYNALAALPNVLRDASLLGVDLAKSDSFAPPWPDLVIAAGRRAAPVARYIKRQHANTKLVQLMNPGGAEDAFDLIALPEHDGRPETGNVMTTLLAPHGVTQEKLHAAAEYWRPRFAHLPRPWVVLLVGGANRGAAIPAEGIDRMIEVADRWRGEGSLLITTSRRTGRALESAIASRLRGPHYMHAWKAQGENPYLGMLALADRILVTGDSISMISEALSADAPVGILNLSALPPKHARFQQGLYRQGIAVPADSTNPENIDKNKYVPLDASLQIAARIQKLFNN